MIKQNHFKDKHRVGITSRIKDKSWISLTQDKTHSLNLKQMFDECCRNNNRFLKNNIIYYFDRVYDIYKDFLSSFDEFESIKVDVYQIKRENIVCIDVIVDKNYILRFTWDIEKDNTYYYTHVVKYTTSVEPSISKKKLRMCIDKHQYQTYNSALAACSVLSAKRYAYCRAYKCPYCGKYHITTKKMKSKN